MPPFNYPVPPTNSPDIPSWVRIIAEHVQRIMVGRTNNVLDVTLDANQASTTVTDARITSQSALLFMPRTANAAAELATLYVPDSGRVHGTVSITHANNAQTDRDFYVVIVG